MDVRKPKYHQELLKDAIDSAMSYREFRELVSELAKNNGTTGPEQSEAYKNYTTLNDRRMKRWDKTLRIPDDHLDIIKHFDQKVYWLVITESWCGDAAPSLPVMNKIAEENENIALRIILRSDSPEVMDLFLTDGKQSIPKLVVLDQDYKAISTWGPLPTKAAEIAAAYKAEHGVLTAEFKEELQHWFNADKGKDVLLDLVELLTLKEVGDRS
ncbi:thioredoxin family protein [Muriicola marianensis]|uniref:Thioredoxin n=1 Tax=Muriicola marianensis TaxID=1324801 RepID=A0ABQ1QZ15_9FLAO|nr:thioredoxin family protein [Muriicola marianensis]GGD52449.1 thioredoxin [Muriicola marianensis]